ncbi:hypothetical protein PR048_020058 [Dryococelus australis]|uniref:PiggyBac transposable element-derived protein domain-containing protein n=1 Tax=Dryococelus australis TaxID=614101 RepID=A0ABQ9H576_9NEOP|nr:hypothetical protein PR048_020058 [Dryococelus australis]
MDSDYLSAFYDSGSEYVPSYDFDENVEDIQENTGEASTEKEEVRYGEWSEPTGNLFSFSYGKENNVTEKCLRLLSSTETIPLDIFNFFSMMKLRRHCHKFQSPEENMAIDESLIPFRGRLKFRQYIPNKRHRYGIKVYKLWLLQRYTWHAKIYTGKEERERCPIIYGNSSDEEVHIRCGLTAQPCTGNRLYDETTAFPPQRRNRNVLS